MQEKMLSRAGQWHKSAARSPGPEGNSSSWKPVKTAQRVPGKPGLQSGDSVLKQNDNKKYKDCVFYDHMRFDI